MSQSKITLFFIFSVWLFSVIFAVSPASPESQRAIDNILSAEAAPTGVVFSNVPVHVCGTHASWRDLTAEDFPEYVTVSPSGPAAIRDYEKLGYVLVIL